VREVLDNTKNSMDFATRFTSHFARDYNQGYVQDDPAKFMSMIFQGQDEIYSFGMVAITNSRRCTPQKDNIIYRSKGEIKSDTGRFLTSDKTTNEWIEHMLNQSNPEWSAPFYNSEIGSRSVIYAYPFHYLLKKKLNSGILFCSVSLKNTLKDLSNPKKFNAGFNILLNENNQIVFHPDFTKTGEKIFPLINIGNCRYNIGNLLEERTSGLKVIKPENSNSSRMVAIYWMLKSSKWFIIIMVPLNQFLSEFKQFSLILIPVILFIVSVFIAALIYNSLKLLSPISHLANDSRRILADEDIPSEPPLQRPDNPEAGQAIAPSSPKFPASALSNIEILSRNIEKIKDRLAIYKESFKQNTYNKDQIDKELILARDIEMGLVPVKFPLVPGRNDFDCFGKLIPAKIVGGDLFDIFLLNENILFIWIADTMGKGIPAAMYSVMIHTLIRSIANPITRLGKMMESVNEALGLIRESDMFATILLGKLDLISGEFTYCNAGHLHPVILRNDNREEVMAKSHGIPIGVKRNLQFEETRTFLTPGESFIAFSDGITEQFNESGELFGNKRLISVLHQLHHSSSQDLISQTLNFVEDFRGTTEVHDDIAMVALKYTGK
jgi:sigma-B regulation protein RsbU (phosphoserine phosphatase)